MYDDFLMHYGIKGMKWGVRKAVQKGDVKNFAKHYKKANKKLNRLNQKASINNQKVESKKYAKRAAISGSLGAAAITMGSKNLIKTYASGRNAGANIGTGVGKIVKNNGIKIYETIIPEKKIKETIIPEKKIKETFIHEDTITNSKPNKSNKINLRKVSIISGLGALGYAGYAGGRSLAAKYRTTPKGHAKAVSKRNLFKSEMTKAFNQPGSKSIKRKMRYYRKK